VNDQHLDPNLPSGLTDTLRHFDLNTGLLEGQPRLERRLSDLEGIYSDAQVYQKTLALGNPVVYSVSSLEPGAGAGDLHYGLGVIQPGRVGQEFFMTKGHLHEWREAAEVYIGLSGAGLMLLEHESGGELRAVPFGANSIVYVPGFTAHRTVNVGTEALKYIGVYPARAGHDYGAIRERNFAQVVIAAPDGYRVLERSEFHKQSESQSESQSINPNHSL
jgi:glucose-6-phosphate isomerase, archaeal